MSSKNKNVQPGYHAACIAEYRPLFFELAADVLETFVKKYVVIIKAICFRKDVKRRSIEGDW